MIETALYINTAFPKAVLIAHTRCVLLISFLFISLIIVLYMALLYFYVKYLSKLLLFLTLSFFFFLLGNLLFKNAVIVFFLSKLTCFDSTWRSNLTHFFLFFFLEKEIPLSSVLTSYWLRTSLELNVCSRGVYPNV